MKRYIKNIKNIASDKIQIPRLLQLKSYLNIIKIPYYAGSTNLPITSDDIEVIIKSNYIFNDLILASKPRIIKASSKSDIAIIWIDIWDMQWGKNGKILINRYFNVERHIATIHSVNMNLDVP